MKTSLTTFLATVFVVLMSLASADSFANDKNIVNSLLDSLDNAVEQRQVFLDKKLTVINDMKRSLGEIQTSENLVTKYEQIYTEYLHLNGDSAILYAQKAVDAAQATKKTETMLTANFCLLRAYTRQGAMGKAHEITSSLGDIDNVPAEYQAIYADLLLDFYTRVSGKAYNGSKVNLDAAHAWEKYSKCLDKNSVEYNYNQALITGNCNVKNMEKSIANLPFPSFTRAAVYYALSFEYKRRGDMDKCYTCLILSSINDVLLGNTEAASLLELLQTPLLENDLKRENAYIQVCADNVKQYNDQLRALTVIDVQGKINKRLDESRNKRMTATIIAANLFFLAFIISVIETILAIKRGRKVKRSLEELKVMHARQTELIERQKQLSDELKEANSRLSDRLYAYRNDFVNVYQLVSTYINYEKNLFKNLLNQLKTNNVRKAISTLNSGTDIDDQLKNFYQHFDHAFLAMYPDFIHRVNTLLKPDSQLDESKTELTTSLRIYALLILGISDGAGIADFLHISSQTIYNYRLRMRRLAIHGDKQFDEEVARLYY